MFKASSAKKRTSGLRMVAKESYAIWRAKKRKKRMRNTCVASVVFTAPAMVKVHFIQW